MPRYAKRQDANHGPIKDVFERLLGGHVTDSSTWGEGAGDLFVTVPGRSGGWFIEIKIDDKQHLRASQIKFARIHPEAWFRVNSVDEAILTCKHIKGLAFK